MILEEAIEILKQKPKEEAIDIVIKAAIRSSYYDTLERHGLVVKMPVPIGTTLYRVVNNTRPNCNKNLSVRQITLNENNFVRIVLGGEFGKTVFRTQKEAFEALMKMKDDES